MPFIQQFVNARAIIRRLVNTAAGETVPLTCEGLRAAGMDMDVTESTGALVGQMQWAAQAMRRFVDRGGGNWVSVRRPDGTMELRRVRAALVKLPVPDVRDTVDVWDGEAPHGLYAHLRPESLTGVRVMQSRFVQDLYASVYGGEPTWLGSEIRGIPSNNTPGVAFDMLWQHGERMIDVELKGQMAHGTNLGQMLSARTQLARIFPEAEAYATILITGGGPGQCMLWGGVYEAVNDREIRWLGPTRQRFCNPGGARYRKPGGRAKAWLSAGVKWSKLYEEGGFAAIAREWSCPAGGAAPRLCERPWSADPGTDEEGQSPPVLCQKATR